MQLSPPAGEARFIDIGWVIGFVDGEGCFSISFVRQHDRPERKGYRSGFQVTHEFVVTQGEKSIASLHALQSFFGVGQVIANARRDNHKEPLQRYVVRRRHDLAESIIPFFRRYPLRTAKQGDFIKFDECFRLIQANQHLIHSGMLQIAATAQTMNRKKRANGGFEKPGRYAGRRYAGRRYAGQMIDRGRGRRRRSGPGVAGYHTPGGAFTSV